MSRTLEIAWAGFGAGEGGEFQVEKLTGWLGLTDPSGSSRANRTVMATGWCSGADDALARFMAQTAPNGTYELTIAHAGRTLSVDADVLRAAPTLDWETYDGGFFEWSVQWGCDGHLLYGAPVTVLSMLAQPGTGLALPTSLPASFPANPVGGSFSTVNDGTATAPAVYTLRGPMTQPGVLLNAGTTTQRMVQYNLSLGADDFLTIDTKEGAFLNGEYRPSTGGSDIVGDLGLAPGSNTVQALGTPSAGSPYISVTFRPAYW